jgi:2-dehydropantoate 2-reductase
MRFHVAGLGSVGTLVAYHLRRVLPSQHTVTLIAKNRLQADKLRSKYGSVSIEDHGAISSLGGFEFEWAPMKRLASPFDRVHPQADAVSELGDVMVKRKRLPPLECLVVTTKAPGTMHLIQRYQDRITNRTTIVLLQNGMGVYERLVREVFRDPRKRPHFILTTNTHGAWLKTTGLAVHAGHGEIEFGVVPDPRQNRDFEKSFHDSAGRPEQRKGSLTDVANPGADDLAQHYLPLRNTISALSAMELNTRWRPITDIEIAMRRKLVVNAVINPLTCIMGCRNREVFAHPSSIRILSKVCAEAEAVFRAQLRQETREWQAQQTGTRQAGADPASTTFHRPSTSSAEPNQATELITPSNAPLAPETEDSQAAAHDSQHVELTSPAAAVSPEGDMVAQPSKPSSSGNIAKAQTSSRVQTRTQTQTSPLAHQVHQSLIDDPPLPGALSSQSLFDYCIEVARKTGDNVSSMLSDLKAGKETEIDFLNGYLISLGAQYNVPMPTTDMLLHMVKIRSAIPLDGRTEAQHDPLVVPVNRT